MTIPPPIVLAILLSRPPYYGDRNELAAERESRLAIVAEAISLAARSRSEVAILVALGEHETGFGALVQLGRCDEMPSGQRCDGGKARGPWQLHIEACRAAFALPEGSSDSIRTEAQCAISLLRWNAERGKSHTLTPQRAAFCGYAGKPWSWVGAEVRERTAKRILASWGRP